MDQLGKTVETLEEAVGVLFETPSVTVTLRNGTARKVMIHKVSLRSLPVTTAFLQSLLNHLKVSGGKPTIDIKDISTILHLIAEALIDVTDVILSLTEGLSREELLDLYLDDSARVIAKLWEVNATFFTQKILPMVEAAARTGE